MTLVEPQAEVETEAVAVPDTAVEIEPQVDAGAVPRPVPALDFFGEYQGSGYAEPRYLVRRSDGQVIQLTLLLDLCPRARNSMTSAFS